MAGVQLKSKNAITLRGSAELIAEYLNYGINSILYQRGIYPTEWFDQEEKYGLKIQLTTNENIKEFLKTVLGQARDWIVSNKIQKLALVLINVDTKETMERWEFQLKLEEGVQLKGDKDEVLGQKELRVIQKEIREVMCQIISSVTVLPLLDCRCSFDVLMYTDVDCAVPGDWGEAAPRIISNCQKLEMRTFSTSVHKLGTGVCYKLIET